MASKSLSVIVNWTLFKHNTCEAHKIITEEHTCVDAHGDPTQDMSWFWDVGGTFLILQGLPAKLPWSNAEGTVHMCLLDQMLSALHMLFALHICCSQTIMFT